ncbi:ABC transporter ATP-binding protein [Brevundimonas sp. 2R-24]|uniref:ABC transporter ATP-binding protein n=1 Tax=Peiella sedimenti TaxID=3061083 RepID=A0ABT8SRP3_9CAUL|nr:ABC transporter ATP-binding protein [Caulobacteraceae bacterium XZ-24]
MTPITPTAEYVLPTGLQGPFAVSTHALTKRFGAALALDAVSLQVPEGAVYVLAGANGAGKTTLLTALLDLVRPDEGRAEVLGLDTHRQGAMARAQIGYMPGSVTAAFPWLRIGQFLSLLGGYYPGWDASYVGHLTERLDLDLNARIRGLSKGQTRRFQLVCALSHRPPVLILDEPTDGLDPEMRDEALGLLSEHLADTGGTVLLATHHAYEVEGLADHVGIMRAGRLILQTPREVLQSQLLIYRADGPEGWAGPAHLDAQVIARARSGREIQWTVWGDKRTVEQAIEASGGVVRSATPLGLDQAVTALMRTKELR